MKCLEILIQYFTKELALNAEVASADDRRTYRHHMGGGSIVTKESIKDFHDADRVLTRAADSMYLLPHPALGTWISNYTTTFPGPGMLSDGYAVIPHGCATLVFTRDGSGISAKLFGPLTKPVCVGIAANCFDLLFIVEFQLAGYYAFSGMLQKELTDCVLPFEDVNPSLQRLIAQRLETAPSIKSLIAEVDRLFLAHLKLSFYSQEFFLANRMIIDSSGLATVKEISQNVCYSERHLNSLMQ